MFRPANPRKRPLPQAVLAGDVYACQQCLYNSADRSHMSRHIATAHGGGQACEKCGRVFMSKSALTRHTRVCAPSTCATCRKTFPTALTLRRHVCELACRKCRRVFSTQGGLNKHESGCVGTLGEVSDAVRALAAEVAQLRTLIQRVVSDGL